MPIRKAAYCFVYFEELADKLKAHVSRRIQDSPSIEPIANESIQVQWQISAQEALNILRIFRKLLRTPLSMHKPKKLYLTSV